MPAQVSLITVNFNQTSVTCELLESIRQQDFQDLEIIVVDNASDENPAPIFLEKYPEVKFVRSERNLGFAGGNNLGIRQASGNFLFFVNNDTEITSGCLQTLVNLLSENEQIGMVSPLICYHSEKTKIQYAGMTPVHPTTARNHTIGQMETNRQQFCKPQPTAYAHGAAMMMPRRAFEAVGAMPEDFFLYYEELDWCDQIRRAGFQIWVEPRALIFHKESLTVSKFGALKTYFLNRNRVLFMRRNFGGGLRLVPFFLFLLFVTVPKNCFQFLLRGEFSNFRAFVQGVFWNFFPHHNRFEDLLSAARLGNNRNTGDADLTDFHGFLKLENAPAIPNS